MLQFIYELYELIIFLLDSEMDNLCKIEMLKKDVKIYLYLLGKQNFQISFDKYKYFNIYLYGK